MSYFLYNIIVILLFILIAPFYFIKIIFTDRYRKTWRARLGVEFTIPVDADNIIWIHAASAGEVKTAITLLNRLADSLENARWLVTTSTHSGYKMASAELQDRATVQMLAADLPWIIGPVVERIDPLLTVIIEPDTWPNFIKYAAKKGNLLMVNGWHRHKMIQKIGRIGSLLPRVMDFFDLITVQTEEDKQQFKKYISGDKITVAGNMKYDQTKNINNGQVNSNLIKANLKLSKEDCLFIAGSTHENEEEIILDVYKRLKADKGSLVLLIAPRHIERADKILKLCANRNLDAVKKTDLVKKEKRIADIIILDTLGELSSIYPLAAVTFIGGTLIDQGGHNILEALAGGNPVIFGPHYYNFKDMFEMVEKNKAGFKVTTAEEFLQMLRDLLGDNEKLSKISKRARGIINNNKGALDKNIEIIEKMYDK